MNTDEAYLAELLEPDFLQPFQGWDFSYLTNRRIPLGSPPWDYETLAVDLLKRSKSVLDLDTGGGELLSKLLRLSSFIGEVHASEAHKPNLTLAQRNLHSYGVMVHDTSATTSVLPRHRFYLILNRHGGSIDCEEAYGLLTSGGLYLTQQVGEQTNRELRKAFGGEMTRVRSFSSSLSVAAQMLEAAGFVIRSCDEHTYMVRFVDVGAMVYYLKAVPWEVPGFHYRNHLKKLLEIYKKAELRGYALDSTFHSFFVVAQKR